MFSSNKTYTRIALTSLFCLITTKLPQLPALKHDLCQQKQRQA